MQDYTTVFDVAHKGFDWWFPAFGLIFIFLAAIIVRRQKASIKWAYAIGAFVLLWSIASFLPLNSRFRDFRRAYQSGFYQVVEGPVEDFHPMPWQGHEDECFSVQRVRFCYSDYSPTPGFNNTSSHGGPIRAGLPVRVSYLRDGILGDSILKLEIRSDSAPSLSEIRRRKLDAIELDLIFFGALPAVALAINAVLWLYNKSRAVYRRRRGGPSSEPGEPGGEPGDRRNVS